MIGAETTPAGGHLSQGLTDPGPGGSLSYSTELGELGRGQIQALLDEVRAV